MPDCLLECPSPFLVEGDRIDLPVDPCSPVRLLDIDCRSEQGIDVIRHFQPVLSRCECGLGKHHVPRMTYGAWSGTTSDALSGWIASTVSPATSWWC